MNKLLSSGIIKTEPKKWSKEEEQLVFDLRRKGKSSKQIAVAVGRSIVSVSIKLKRLTKVNDTYNSKHRDDKYNYNELFVNLIKPKSILDVYAGNSFYKKYDNIKVVTNDINDKFNCDYNKDAFKLLCYLHYNGEKFDLIDLDPYGSAIDLLPLVFKMAKKGLVITLGEMGHLRWKRIDFVEKWYQIGDIKDFTSENIINYIIRMAKAYKLKLTPVFIREYNLISRVYFTIEKEKTLSQWSKNKLK